MAHHWARHELSTEGMVSPMTQRKVVLTGATGYIAHQILPSLRERYDLTLFDVKQEDVEGRKLESVIIADLSDPDLEKYREHFKGVDTVIHLAYKRRRGQPLDDFYDEKVNVEMAYNVYRLAYEEGVRRVVIASSNHAADWYEDTLIHDRKKEMLEPYELPLSNNFYGWCKATYEHLGFLFACGAFGRKLEVVMLRIGYTRGALPQEVRIEDFPNDPRAYKRHLGAYISQRDLCQLVTKAIETPNIENEHGIPWLIVYGISDNARSFWSLTSARQVLGYLPKDDSEVKYAADIRQVLTGDDSSGGVGKLGP